MVNTTWVPPLPIMGLVVFSLVLFYTYNFSNLNQFDSLSTFEQDQHENIIDLRSTLSTKPSSAIITPAKKYGNTTKDSISFSLVEKLLQKPAHATQTVQYKHNNGTEPSLVIEVLTKTLGNTTNNDTSTFTSIEKALLQQAVQVVPSQKSDLNVKEKISSSVETKQVYEAGHDTPNKHLCPHKGVFLQFLVLITSAPNNVVNRMAIRQTWGHYTLRKDMKMGFVLSRTETPELFSKIKSESDLYRDIIVCKFIDSYNNLTLKVISMMEWIDSYCPKVKFILKTDDDMFINVPKLISFVESQHNTTRTIFGRLAQNWHPIRDPSSKWFISKEHYAPEVFPDFTTGPAYLFTGDIAHDLYVKALNTTYLKLEDVFMTGVVAQGIGAKRFNAKEFLNTEVKHSVINLKNYISIHKVKYHEQFDLWTKLLDSRE